MTHTFTPPGVERKFSTGDDLWDRAHLTVGITLLKNGSSYTQEENPADEDVAAADVAYLGGHTYTISDAEASALTEAGYGAYIS